MKITDLEKRVLSSKERLCDIEAQLAVSQLNHQSAHYIDLTREYAHIQEIVATYEKLCDLQKELHDIHGIIDEDDLELQEMAEQEAELIQTSIKECTKKLTLLLIPQDPKDKKNAIIEIRAGTGGDEASLFVADLYRMYSRYSETQGWIVEILHSSETEVGGFREISLSLSGKEVYRILKNESGIHRVQRIPSTESSGRIHTSAVSVAVLAEAEETDVHIRPEDLKIDVYRSSGPGGQSVNTTDSAVRITHVPSGMVVTCQDEKSQHKNKAKALRVLKARLYEAEAQAQKDERDKVRKSQIGTGDRSERIRTYNFPQNRVTDHRINLTLYQLDIILDGKIELILEPLMLARQNE